MFRKALMLKIVSWLILSPAYAVAAPLHCRADVRATMNRAWMEAKAGSAPYEALFLIRADGSIDYRGSSHEYHKMHIDVPKGTIAIFHTHPNEQEAQLSDTDERLADYYGLVIYAITNQGLFRYSHPLGAKKVREDLTWEKPCQ